MGLSAATIRRLAESAPVEEAQWPPFVEPQPGMRLHLVCRWDEGQEPRWFWRQVIRFAFWWDGTWLSPQKLEIIGPASSEEKAQAASLDATYCSFPLTVDEFLPREPVNLRGLRFWKRKLHRLFWHKEPAGVDSYEVVRRSEAARLREAADPAVLAALTAEVEDIRRLTRL
jgi:hypothetical protein